MAEIIIGAIVDNLATTLANEANLLLGIEDEVKSLQAYLKFTHAYLQNFKDDNQNANPIVTEYVSQIKDLVHEAEDVIDGYVAKVAQQQIALDIIVWKPKLVFTRRSVAKKIANVKRRFEEIQERRDQFGIDHLPQTEGPSAPEERFPLEDTDVVGLEENTRMIISRLKTGNEERGVIPIVGMSGIGKTTLARKVINDPGVISHFDLVAWVPVKGYTLRELFETILKTVTILTEDDKTASNEELGQRIYHILKVNRYLIVLDDVWHISTWQNLQCFLPGNRYKSRIIITTQRKDVALDASNENSTHYLKFMTTEDSYHLLFKTVFRGEECPLELRELGEEIAEKCGGLPLAIVVIAGVLRRKEKTNKWWSRVASNVSAVFNDERKKQTKEIFALSYENLPNHLRPCFLYFGHFPEGVEIPTRQLTTLWIAEGFVPKKNGISEEENAEEFLEELIDRNLIQLMEKKFDGSVKLCRIHDLLRHYCISKASEGKEIELYQSSSPPVPSSSRRLSTHSNTVKCISHNKPSSTVRSLLSFGEDQERLLLKHWKMLYKSYNLIRVLDLWGVVVDNIPSHIEKLICLRYLRLKSDVAESIPITISNLWNLQFLEIIAPQIKRPKVNIWKMRQLRHFYFNGEVVIPDPPNNVVDFQINLQTLSNISPDCCTDNILCAVPNLVTLGIYGDLENFIDQAFNSLPILSVLKKLKLIRDIHSQSLTRFPDSVKFPPTLVKLTIYQTKLSVDPMKQLGNLPLLQFLKLVDDAYSGEELNCIDCEFPKLEVLKLVNLGVKMWSASIGSMPSLKSVVISMCEELSHLPSSLQEKSTLRDMQLWWPNRRALTWAINIEECLGKENLKVMIYYPKDEDDME